MKSARSAIPASRVASAPDASVVVNVVVEAYVPVSEYHTSRVSHPAHPDAESTPAERESPDPIVISSTAHEEAVERQSIRAVLMFSEVALSPL